MLNVTIRTEEAVDKAAVFQLNCLAFEQTDEAQLVTTLQDLGEASFSFVALVDNQIVGHILFSTVTIEHNPSSQTILGLAPLAVLPEFQGQTIGSQLIRASLEHCQNLGVDAIVVLGHPSYYPKFGFKPAADYELRYKGLDIGDAFMVLEMKESALASLSGAVHYAEAFDDLS